MRIWHVLKFKLSFICLSVIVCAGCFYGAALAAPDPYLTGSGTLNGYTSVAMPINNVQVAGTGNPTVPVKLRVTSGTLAMGTTTGLTFTGGSTGSTLQFSGTMSNVNAALATLTYTRASVGTDTLEASLVQPGEVFFEETGHLYEYVSYNANWVNSNTNAQTRTKYGATGYLTTISSQAENDFVAARLSNAGWMGAADSASEGDWKWVTGPESGTSFWSGLSGGSPVGGRYSNWGTGEPNNSGDEDCAQFLTGGSGKWNDLPCSSYALPGYVVEYGSPSSPIEISSLNLAITTEAANITPSTPTSLGATSYINGSWGNDATPSLSFSLSDGNAGSSVRYRVQIDDSSDFSSPVVDYTSGLAAQGTRSFTVGQATGSGTYATGSSGQELSNGNYYWRVKAIDSWPAESSYATANSGSIAFRIDVSAPSTPTGATVTTEAQDTTPTITWDVSTDSGSGLPATPYTVQWSQSPSFSSFSGATTNTNSYTISNPGLADGMWYFRIQAADALGNSSGYSASASVNLDTTPPSVPGKPAVQTISSDATPSWLWDESTDLGTGLSLMPYLFEWSRVADFSSGVFTTLAPSANYTHTSALNDGVWYVRVKAVDLAGNASAYSAIEGVTIYTPTRKVEAAPVISPRPVILAPSGQVTTIAQDVAISNPGTNIYLNDYQEYIAGTGKPLTLNQGQVIYFTHKEEDHSATVKEVGASYVVVTVASTPTDVMVRLGETVEHDVNDDGINDISITYKGMINDKADLVFKQLVVKPEIANTHSTEKLKIDYWWLLWLLLIAAMILILVTRDRNKSKKH